MMRLEPDLVWSDGAFRRDTSVTFDPETGRITAVEPGGRGALEPRGRPAAANATRAGEEAVYGSSGDGVRLPGRALIPGFVNGHSHAFQRLGRGRTQTRPGARSPSDFWSWREAMYGIALSLSADDIYDVSRFCFLEMLRTGITAVGEFHYLHHRPDGAPYPDANELANRVIAAAESVGIRIALLNVCYATGGIGRDLEPRQRRFRADDVRAFLDRTEALREAVSARAGGGGGGGGGGGSLALVGVAPHSVRAVPREWLGPIRDWAVDHDTPIHMHVSERPAEVEACLGEYGLRPVELLAEEGLLGPRLTAVHATHLDDREVALLGDSGTTCCACPTTERDLADGFLPGLRLFRAGAPISLGTDSHTNLDMLEEMRLVEYHERLQRLERVVMAQPVGEELRVAPALMEMATAAGARSIGIDAGSIAAGRHADLVAIDLEHPSLAGWSDDTLAAMLTLSATPDVVRDVWVGGERRLEDGRHRAESEVAKRFRRVATER